VSRPLKLVAFDFGHTLIDERVPLETDAPTLMPGARDAVSRIALPMAVWANTRQADETDVRRCLERLDLNRFFCSVITSVDAGARKPARRFFEYALRQAGVVAADVVFVGNQRNTDVVGAEAVGIETIWLSGDGYRSRDDGPCEATPTYTVETLTDVPALIEQLVERRSRKPSILG
jgi:FMN phosphatase YigB (HAD superfamily)